MKRARLTLTVLPLLAAAAAFGQSDDLRVISLGDLLAMQVVSATGSDSALGESPVPISVITAEEIQESGLDSIPEVLARLAEIDIIRIGQSQTEVSIRGKGINFSRRVLVLIDGRTEYNDLFGTTLWHALPITVDDIERIEVVRGPASALFGANAFSGVINIITKRADTDDENVQVRLHRGSHDLETATFSYHRSFDRLSFRLAAGGQTHDSGEAELVFPGFNRIPTTVDFAPDEDSLDMDSGNLVLRFAATESIDIRLAAGTSDGEVELIPQPGLPRESWQVESENIQVGIDISLSQNRSLHINAYENTFDYATPLVPTTAAVNAIPTTDGRHFFPSVDEATLFQGEVETLDFSMQLAGTSNGEDLRYVAGAEYRDIDSRRGLATDGGREIKSVFSNLTYRLAEGRWQLGAGIRVDHDSITDTDLGYTTSVAWFPREGRSLRFTGRKAFRAPSLFELNGAIDLNVPNQNQRVRLRGNPALEVEEIFAFDLGWTEKLSDTLQLEAEVYREDLQSLIGNPDSGLLEDIELDPNTNTFITTTSFQNLADATTQGLQIGLTWIPSSAFDGFINAAYADPDGLNNLQGETFFTPEHKLNAGFTWRAGHGLVVDLSAHWVDKTDADELSVGDLAPNGPNFTRDTQEAYSWIDLKVGWRPDRFKGLELYVVANNLGDDEHIEYAEFDAVLKAVGEPLGQEIWGGVSWKF